MSTSGLFKKYIWLVDVIYSSGGITREEIDRRWSRCSLNEDHENGIPERTFHAPGVLLSNAGNVQTELLLRPG